jgi:putative SbcD/Mre11-related phosphoesterase
MNFDDFQPIPNESVLFCENKELLIIADLHIGIEKELREQGLNPPLQTPKLIENIISLCVEYKPKDIILLGDVKHNIPISTFRERKDVKELLELLTKYGKIHILPGNHDGNISRYSSDKIIIHRSDGFIIEETGLLHGHCWPRTELINCKSIIIGHTHPTVMLKDRLGYKTYEPCWLQGSCFIEKIYEKYKKKNNPNIIIMPAFNKLCGGLAVNCEGIMGPFSNIINVDESKLFLLDGTFLGKVKEIKKI